MRRLIVVLGLALSASAAAEPPPQKGPLPLQSQLPDAGWPDLSGRTVELPSLIGKPVLINLWASWCPPCIAELPILVALHEAHAAEGLQVVGINIDVDLDTAETQTEKHRLPYTVLHDAQGVSARPFRVQQIPASFLYDAAGKLVWQSADEIEADDPSLKAALKRVLPRTGPDRTAAPDPSPRARPDARLWPLRTPPSPIPPAPSR